MEEQPRRLRRRRVIGWTAIAFSAAVCLALAIASVTLNGPRLGRLVTRLLPKIGMAGTIEAASVTWRPRLLFDLLIDRPTPFVVEGVRFTDPEGQEVLWAPRVEVKIRPRSAFGLEIILSDLVLAPGARWRFAEMKRSPEIGFLSVFDLGEPVDRHDVLEEEPTDFVFQITNAKLAGFEMRFDFPGAWGLHLKDVHAPGSLLVQGDYVLWSSHGLDARGGGFLELIGERLPWDRVKVRKIETIRERPDDIFLDVEEASTGSARLRASGYFQRLYGFGVPAGQLPPQPGAELWVALDDAAPAISAVLAPYALPGLTFAGDAHARGKLSGPFIDLRIAGDLWGLDVDWQGRPARQVASSFTIRSHDIVEAEVKKLVFGDGGSGRAELSGRLRDTVIDAALALRRMRTEPYLPAALDAELAGRLDGQLSARLDFGKPSLDVQHVDLKLDRPALAARQGGQEVRLHGKARATPSSATTEGLVLELPGAVIRARGRYGVAHQLLGFGLRLTAAQLPRALGAWGLPPVARAADVDLEVDGQLLNPNARGSITVTGVAVGPLPPIDQVTARLALEKGLARVEGLTSDAYGGKLQGQGQMQLYQRSLLRPSAEPAFDGTLDASNLDLAKLLPALGITGRIGLHAEARGTPFAFTAKAMVPGPTMIDVLGAAWRLAGLRIDADGDGLIVKQARLERVGGGVIEIAGKAGWEGPIALGVNIEGVPLAGIPGIGRAGVPIGGRLASRLDIAGTWERPRVDGDVRVEQVVVRDVALGKGHLSLRSTPDGGVTASGDLFGRLTVGGEVKYGAAGPIITARGQVRDFRFEEFFPEMTAFGDARGRLAGTVDFSYGGANPMTVDLRLSDLELSAARDATSAGSSTGGRLTLRNATPVRIILAGTHLVVDRTRLVTQGGDLKLWGELKDDSINAELAGALDLELVQAFLGNRVEGLGGEFDLALRVKGTPQKPIADGNLTVVRPIVLRLPGVEPSIVVPTASLKLDSESLTLSNLVVEAEGARLQVGGRAAFGLRREVESLDFTAGGDLSGALFEALAGGEISDASGRARLNVRVTGTGAAPAVKGRLDLAGLDFRLRELGRDVAVVDGSLELNGLDVVVRNVRARVDGQGDFLLGAAPDLPGRITLRGQWPSPELASVKLPVRGQRLSLRASSAVELDDVSLDVDVGGDADGGFVLDGEITVASGRYVRDYDLRVLVITPSIDETEVKPFYAGNRLLERLGLRLRVRTNGDTFVVHNNLVPELHMAFDLQVKGTLAEPRIAGEVRPTDGQFHLFGVRQQFELVPNVNQITFVETKSLAIGETPELNLEAETIVTDQINREHSVRVRITGPLAQMHIDLSTNTGLDRSQVLLLLVSGRTGDADGLIASASPAGGSVGSGGTDVIGQLFADILEPWIEDNIADLSRGNLNLRPVLGPEGVDLRADLRLGRQFDLHFSFLQGLESKRQFRIASSLWLMDYITLRGLTEQVTYSPQQGLVEDTSSLKLELSMDFPIRLFLR